MAKKIEELDWDRLRGLLVDSGASANDIDRFDALMSRRRFFGLVGKGGAVAALAGLGAGTEAALTGLFGRGMLPVAWAEEAQENEIPGKPGMLVHNTRPVNGEFPPPLLDDDVTPSQRHFVRNNGLVPARATAWSCLVPSISTAPTGSG